MAKKDSRSLGDKHTFAGGRTGQSPQSLSDEATLAGGGLGSGTQSLGDQSTMGGGDGAAGDVGFDDDMEIVDLAARYKTEGVLGQGGMGEVLLATDTRLERKVAIKRMLGEAAGSRTAVHRFLTEAQSIAALNHPNIVQIYDYGRAADGPFLIMEYVEGRSLLDRCREGAIPLEEALELTCQLCDGLAKAHDANIIHRDIKPANVLLTADGLPKLTDFGLAKDEAADTGRTMAGAVLGTLDFMPPEQRQDATLTDARSDLWSLAATLYQMVTGKSPKIIRFNDVPQSLQDVLGKALEDEKQDRYQTAREFSEALRACLQSAGSAVLEEGDCPACGTKNPTDRKFCRNPECGASLEAPCLSCEAAMPMWEEVCGNCGTKQSDLLEERRKQMATHQSKAESLLKNYDFPGATKLAKQLHDEPDLRLQHLQDWAQKFLTQVKHQKQSQRDHASAQLNEALQHEQACDYKAGIHALRQVPVALRSKPVPGMDERVSAVLDRLHEKQKKSRQLHELIQQRMTDKQLDGLDEHIDALLVLKPQSEDLLKLKRVLSERQQKLEAVRDKAYQAAQNLLTQQDYQGCLRQLGQINPTLATSEIVRLREEAENQLYRVQTLRSEIDAAVESKRWHGLLAKVEEYLRLHPDDEDMQQLKTRLIAREEKNAAQIAQIIEKAQGLRAECRFEAACKALERIPEHLLTDDADVLLQDCTELTDQRQNASKALRRAMQQEKFEGGLRACANYRELLQSERLQDDEFEASYQACREGLEQQEQEIAAAARRRKLMIRLAITGVSVMAVGLLIGVGLLLRSIMNSRALAEALTQEKWDEALTIDAHNFSALVGRARSRIANNPTEALEDLERAASSPINSADLQAQKLIVEDLDRRIRSEEAERSRLLKFVTTTNADRKGEYTGLSEGQARDLNRKIYRERDDAMKKANSLSENVQAMKRQRDAIADHLQNINNTDVRIQLLDSLMAQAYARRATSLATAGKISEAEKDLQESETLGAPDGDLSAARKLLAAAYVSQGEAAVARGDVSGIRAACDTAEKYHAPSGDLNPLRAAAFRAEGEQKETSGDFSGAVSALEEALKLDNSLGLKNERAILHVKLGEQAIQRSDYIAAGKELADALSLDESVESPQHIASLYIDLGRQALAAGDEKTASEALTSAAGLNESDPAVTELALQIARLHVDLGRQALAAGDQKTAFEALTSAVALTDSDPAVTELAQTICNESDNISDRDLQYGLGELHRNGIGGKKNEEEAIRWYRKAAQQGQIMAQFAIATMYSEGEGVPQDYAEAAKWFAKSAEQEYAIAKFNLGGMYALGLGVTQDYAEAIGWYRRAAAQYRKNAGRARTSTLRDLAWFRECMIENDAEGIRWYRNAAEQCRKAAEQGDAEAQYWLGQLYYWGIGMKGNGTEAFNWYLKAAEQGYGEAQYEVGIQYEVGGNGVTRDDSKMIYWYRKAGENGIAMAQYWLGVYYEQGKHGLTKDNGKAAYWYRKAANQGHKKSESLLKRVLSKGK